MKKLILLTITIISTFLSLLPAQDLKDFAVVSIYEQRGETHVYESNNSKSLFKDINVSFFLLKSNDSSLNIDNIKKHDTLFTPVPKEEKFQDTNTTYWLKVNLGTAFPSGRFVYSYADADFTEHTILPSQQLEKFVLGGLQSMKFTYKKGLNSQIYYFKLVPKHYRIPFRFIYVSTLDTFYAHMSKDSHTQLILGLILGLILMAGIYNAAMYYYNKDISFLYYALMQLFMSLLLYTYSGVFVWDENSYFSRNISYQNMTSLITALFATYFTLTFLDVKKYLPILYTVSRIIIILLLIDIVISLFYRSLIIEYYILPFLMLTLIYAGYKRMRQGYKPAQFYLAGWMVLTLAVFMDFFGFGHEYTMLEPLYIGAAVEAILFSLALSYKMRMVAKEREEHKELLVHQSKLASMGEMIGNIAHQWRQPLTHLSYTMMNLKEAQKHGELNEQYLDKKVDDATTQLAFMSQTIDDFKDFYVPNKAKETFSLLQATQETLDIMKNTLTQNKIDITLTSKTDAVLHSYKNEYKQVLLNLLSNAKDALVEREIQPAHISIELQNHTVTVSDNAGGIDEKISNRIFEPYFTTKENNSGIGLYMSKIIVERNLKGILKIANHKKGATFTLTFY